MNIISPSILSIVTKFFFILSIYATRYLQSIFFNSISSLLSFNFPSSIPIACHSLHPHFLQVHLSCSREQHVISHLAASRQHLITITIFLLDDIDSHAIWEVLTWPHILRQNGNVHKYASFLLSCGHWNNSSSFTKCHLKHSPSTMAFKCPSSAMVYGKLAMMP